jgi:hypothetical protein
VVTFYLGLFARESPSTAGVDVPREAVLAPV